jgi:hypothetical protein
VGDPLGLGLVVIWQLGLVAVVVQLRPFWFFFFFVWLVWESEKVGVSSFYLRTNTCLSRMGEVEVWGFTVIILIIEFWLGGKYMRKFEESMEGMLF